ncbi:ABC transporter ATP-binding protein [Clostridium pasteurianum]|uniref:ABC transporter ATP-binding protein n=1 Tax=Clostridium pasteurianum TaxID=1501 RepID=UPI002260A257|nr:ABC transporter ATP-binding protein [Clostridium pasteurianum]UZW14752.1 ABC transporter ATP-binding protein [Clostridium pasteurianum]
MNNIILVENLTQQYGDFLALNNVSFKVNKGEFLGILGPNGAGKTTLFNLLSGITLPTQGKIVINNEDISKFSFEFKKKIGVLCSNLGLYNKLTCLEFLQFLGNMYGIQNNELEKNISYILDVLQLDLYKNKVIEKCSTGTQKKIGLAGALIHKPEILILDEPFESVDAIVAYNIKSLLKDFISNQGTIIISSHILEIVQHLCSKVLILNKGKILLESKISDLNKKSLEEYFIDIIKKEEKNNDK